MLLSVMQVIFTSKESMSEFESVLSFVAKSVSGVLQVKTGHAEMFVVLPAGECKLKFKNKTDQSITITGGVCHVFEDTITVVA